MKNILLPVFVMVFFLMLTSATVVDSVVEDPLKFEYETKPMVNMTIAEYPVPLDMNGMYKYHVTINGVPVGMLDDDAEVLLDLFEVKPYTGKEFYEKDLAGAIWMRRNIKSTGFAKTFTKNELQ